MAASCEAVMMLGRCCSRRRSSICIAAGTELHDDLAAAIDVNRGVVQRDYVAAIVTAAHGCFAMAAHGTVDGIVPREAGTAGAAITIVEARTAVIGNDAHPNHGDKTLASRLP